jgi:hypothetical protein
MHEGHCSHRLSRPGSDEAMCRYDTIPFCGRVWLITFCSRVLPSLYAGCQVERSKRGVQERNRRTAHALFLYLMLGSWCIAAEPAPSREVQGPASPAVGAIENDETPELNTEASAVEEGGSTDEGAVLLPRFGVTAPKRVEPRNTSPKPRQLPLRLQILPPDLSLTDSHRNVAITPSRFAQQLTKLPSLVRIMSLDNGPQHEISDFLFHGLPHIVAIDGLPANTSFGNVTIVPWRLEPLINYVEAVTGGGASAWGNGAIGGAMQYVISSEPLRGRQAGSILYTPTTDRAARGSEYEISLSAGDFGTTRVGLLARNRVSGGLVQLSALEARSDGYYRVMKNDRGVVDARLWSRTQSFVAAYNQAIKDDLRLGILFRHYDGAEGGGTRAQQSEGQGNVLMASVASSGWEFSWNARVYGSHDNIANLITAITQDRQYEEPLVHQSSTPCDRAGLTVNGLWKSIGGSTTGAGVDLQTASGRSSQGLNFDGAEFRTQITNGGSENALGLYAVHDRELSSTLNAEVGIRIDHWQEQAESRAPTRGRHGDQFVSKMEDGNGPQISSTLGLLWRPNERTALRINGQHAFRRRSLAEQYQPSYVGERFILPSTELRVEQNTSVNIAAEYDGRRQNGSEGPIGVRARMTMLFHHLVDGIAVVDAKAEDVAASPYHWIPAYQSTGQRTNIDRQQIRGLSLDATWNLTKAISFDGQLMFRRATIRRFSGGNGYAGNMMPNLPDRLASLSSTYNARSNLSIVVALRSSGGAFTDSENGFYIHDRISLDAVARWVLSQDVELSMGWTNITNHVNEIPTHGKTTLIGPPKAVSCELKVRW